MFRFSEATATMVALKFAVIFQCKYVEVVDQNMICSIQYIPMNLLETVLEEANEHQWHTGSSVSAKYAIARWMLLLQTN